ncbi:hypothetical protein PR048_006578 [Dryococelus australis]|uniref:Reverse transcriptase domain-containing protein n=1 Tax=Dryococelus australis TaxID=614101 RepID=A0ABQ9IC15_9NEOP|nr:hypothetical protein PR048_006578 [Dryococelus australis]
MPGSCLFTRQTIVDRLLNLGAGFYCSSTGTIIIPCAADSFKQYRMLRNKCTQLVRRAKMLYSLDSFGSCGTSGDFWKMLRNLGIGKYKTNISSPLNISPEDFNRYFVQSSCCKQVVGDITDTTDINHHDVENESRRNVLYFRRVSLKETYKAIMSIKCKAEGSDCVSIRFIHKIMSLLIFSMTRCQLCDSTVLDDFRPISILPALSEALEFLVYQQVYKFVNDNKLFDSYQSGFRKRHSTCTAHIADSIIIAIDRSHVSILVLLDFSKAFNMVNHDIIL